MTRKTIFFLLLLLILQAGLIAFFYWPGTRETQPVINLFNELAAANVARFTVTDSDGETILLDKDDTGNWQVTSGSIGPYPAASEKIIPLLDTLTSLQSNRMVTRTTSSHIRLQVADELFFKKITLTNQKGESQTLFIGSSADRQAVHVRQETAKEVYIARDISTWQLETDIASWWQRNFVQIDDDTIEEISLTNDHGHFTLTKVEKKGWILAGHEEIVLDQTAVQDFLQQASRITLERYLGKKDDTLPVKKVQATLTLTTNTETLAIKIEPAQGEDDHLVTSTSSPYQVAVNAYTVVPFLEKKKDDLIAPVPENF